MVILKCKICGNEDLKKGPYADSFRCEKCERVIELWQTFYAITKSERDQPKRTATSLSPA
jgi:hypothetical protein